LTGQRMISRVKHSYYGLFRLGEANYLMLSNEVSVK
jgi:hypothetical protein